MCRLISTMEWRHVSIRLRGGIASPWQIDAIGSKKAVSIFADEPGSRPGPADRLMVQTGASGFAPGIGSSCGTSYNQSYQRSGWPVFRRSSGPSGGAHDRNHSFVRFPILAGNRAYFRKLLPFGTIPLGTHLPCSHTRAARAIGVKRRIYLHHFLGCFTAFDSLYPSLPADLNAS
jgi:hypothetical protein